MDNSSHSRSILHWHADADAKGPVVISPASDNTDDIQHGLVLLAVIDVDYGYSELNTAIAAAAAETLRVAFDEKDRPPAISNALRWAMMRALATAKQDTERLTGRSLSQISADAQLDGINMMALAVNGNRIAIAHVGNCRLWGVRNGRSLYQIDYTAPKVEVTEQTFQTGDRYLLATPVIGDAFKSNEVAALLQQNQPDDALLTTLIERARQHGLPQIAAAGVIGRGRVVPTPSTRSAPRPPNALPPPRASASARPAAGNLDDAPKRETRTSAPGGLIAGLSDATVSMIGIIALAAVTLITVLVLYVNARPAAAPEIVTPTATVPAPTEEATIPAEVALPPTITRAPTQAPETASVTRTPATTTADKIITATITTRPRTATPTGTRTATPTVARTPTAAATITRTATPTVALTPTAAATITRTATPSVTPTPGSIRTATRTPAQTVTRTLRPTLAATRRPRRTAIATVPPTVALVTLVPTVQQEATATAQPQPNPQPQPQPTSPPQPQPTSPPPQPTQPPPIPTGLP